MNVETAVGEALYQSQMPAIQQQQAEELYQEIKNDLYWAKYWESTKTSSNRERNALKMVAGQYPQSISVQEATEILLLSPRSTKTTLDAARKSLNWQGSKWIISAQETAKDIQEHIYQLHNLDELIALTENQENFFKETAQHFGITPEKRTSHSISSRQYGLLRLLVKETESQYWLGADWIIRESELAQFYTDVSQLHEDLFTVEAALKKQGTPFHIRQWGKVPETQTYKIVKGRKQIDFPAPGESMNTFVSAIRTFRAKWHQK